MPSFFREELNSPSHRGSESTCGTGDSPRDLNDQFEQIIICTACDYHPGSTPQVIVSSSKSRLFGFPRQSSVGGRVRSGHVSRRVDAAEIQDSLPPARSLPVIGSPAIYHFSGDVQLSTPVRGRNGKLGSRSSS